MAVDGRQLVFFIVSAVGLALLVDVLFYFLGGLSNAINALIWGFLRMYTPAVGAVLADRGVILSRPRITGRLIVYYLIAPAMAFLAIAIYTVLTMLFGWFNVSGLLETLRPVLVFVDPATAMSIIVLNAYVTAITLNALFAFGEELGWRGFLQDRLESLGLGFVRSSLVVGVVWGFWHASAIILLGYNYPENRLLGTLLFPVFTTSMSLPHALVKKMSSSVLPAASLHGAVNAVWSVTLLTTEVSREAGGLGVMAVASWALVSTALYLFYRFTSRRAV